MAETKTKPTPPPAPKLASTDDVKQALAQRRDAAGLKVLGVEDDEETEGSAAEKIRGHLEDASQSLSEAYSLLDSLDGEQS